MMPRTAKEAEFERRMIITSNAISLFVSPHYFRVLILYFEGGGPIFPVTAHAALG
jgi:hypothetical protein